MDSIYGVTSGGLCLWTCCKAKYDAPGCEPIPSEVPLKAASGSSRQQSTEPPQGPSPHSSPLFAELKKAASSRSQKAAPAFIAAASHSGSKPGYVFKTGPLGVGYYADGSLSVHEVATVNEDEDEEGQTWDTEVCIWYARSLMSRMLRGVTRSVALERQVISWLEPALPTLQRDSLLSCFMDQLLLSSQLTTRFANDRDRDDQVIEVGSADTIFSQTVQVTLIPLVLLPQRFDPVDITAPKKEPAEEITGPMVSASASWACSACTLINDLTRARCSACDTAASVGVATSEPSATTTAAPALAAKPAAFAKDIAPEAEGANHVSLQATGPGHGCDAYVLPAMLRAQCLAFEKWFQQQLDGSSDPRAGQPLTWALDHSTAVLTLHTSTGMCFDVLATTGQMLVLLALGTGQSLSLAQLLARVGGSQLAVELALQALMAPAHPLVVATGSNYALSTWSPSSSVACRSVDGDPLVIVCGPLSSAAHVNPFVPSLVLPGSVCEADKAAMIARCQARLTGHAVGDGPSAAMVKGVKKKPGKEMSSVVAETATSAAHPQYTGPRFRHMGTDSGCGGNFDGLIRCSGSGNCSSECQSCGAGSHWTCCGAQTANGSMCAEFISPLAAQHNTSLLQAPSVSLMRGRDIPGIIIPGQEGSDRMEAERLATYFRAAGVTVSVDLSTGAAALAQLRRMQLVHCRVHIPLTPLHLPDLVSHSVSSVMSSFNNHPEPSLSSTAPLLFSFSCSLSSAFAVRITGRDGRSQQTFRRPLPLQRYSTTLTTLTTLIKWTSSGINPFATPGGIIFFFMFICCLSRLSSLCFGPDVSNHTLLT